MDESETVSQENPQDRFENMSCMLSFQLSQDSDLCFDVLWNEDEDLRPWAEWVDTII